VDKHGMPSFPKILRALNDAWVQQRDQIANQAKQFEAGLAHLATTGLEAPSSDLSGADVTSAAEDLESLIDWTHGGFGHAPKFPNPMNVAQLLRGYRRSRSGSLLSAVTLTLERMATGGIYDHLGGGFHRYSVDE